MTILNVETTDDRYFDLQGLARYSGLSVRTLRRHMADATNPLPHFYVRASGKERGRTLFAKSAFDAWMEQFRVDPAAGPRSSTGELSIAERVERAVARSRR
jgi:hypothetical protein